LGIGRIKFFSKRYLRALSNRAFLSAFGVDNPFMLDQFIPKQLNADKNAVCGFSKRLS
jgi:hypothetical protein